MKDGLTRSDSRTRQDTGALGMARHLLLFYSVTDVLCHFGKMNLRVTAHCLVTECLSKKRV